MCLFMKYGLLKNSVKVQSKNLTKLTKLLSNLKVILKFSLNKSYLVV